MSGLPFTVPTARDVAQDVLRRFALNPDVFIGVCYSPDHCLIAEYIHRETPDPMLTVTVRPGTWRERLPSISFWRRIWERTDEGSARVSFDYGTVYMQHDLVQLAKLFDRAGDTFTKVTAMTMIRLIAREMPHLLRNEG